MKLASVLLAVAVASGVGVSFAGLTIDDDIIVKTGADTNEIAAAQIGSRSVRVEGGVLRVLQTAMTRARYIRYTATAVNPWRTVNANNYVQMAYFGLCLNSAELAYPSGTTAINKDGSDASKILTCTHDQSQDWISTTVIPYYFTIDLQDVVEFNGYRLAGATISTGRSPYAFTVDVSVDGEEWFRFDEQKSFCTAGYGYDVSIDGTSPIATYSPRMEPIYALNPIPAFSAQAHVTILAGATLSLSNVCGRVPNLSGSGTLDLVCAKPILTGTCDFTGRVDGYGTLSLAMDNRDLQVGFDSLALKVINAERAHTLIVSGTQEAPALLPELEDSAAAPLDVTLSGAIVRRKMPVKVDRFEQTIAEQPLHGTNRVNNVTISYVSAPTLAKYLRFAPLKAIGTTQNMTGELDLVLDGVTMTLPTMLHVFSDWFKTTNYTSGVMSDQTAMTGRYLTQVNLFDGDPNSYYQQVTVSGTKSDLDNSSAVYQFATIVPFDSVNLWMPSYEKVSNGAYLLGYWNLETSLDGATWEKVLPFVDNTDALGPWGSTAYNRGKIGNWPIEGSAGNPESVPSAEVVYEGEIDCAARMRFVRIQAREIGGRTPETYGLSPTYGYMYDVGEFEIHDANGKIPWPTGATARFNNAEQSDAAGMIDGTQQLPNTTTAWDGYKDNQPYGGSRAISPKFTQEQVAAGVGVVVEAPELSEFSSYRLFTGDNWDGYSHHITKWTVDVSYDGNRWYTVDDADREKNFTPWSRWVTMHWYCTRDVDFSSVAANFVPAEQHLLNATKPLVLGSTACIILTNAAETVGGLAGTGRIAVGGYGSELSVSNAPASRAFAGTFIGENGTLVIDGGTLVLAKADLKGLEKIVLKNGAVLAGRAYFNSNLVIEVGAGCENRLRQIGGMALIVR